MDSATYTALTGKTVSAGQTARFDMQQKVAKKSLERMLGYPLCPDDWDNQYIERGKTDGCFCSITDETELEDPDEVVNSYRFFRWNPHDVNLAIDPATAIHAVKLVQGDVTVKTFDTDEYRPQWENGRQESFVKYLAMNYAWNWRSYFHYGCYWYHDHGLLVAVDADWAFETLPLELKQVWADFIGYALDDKSNIRSESAGTHSYSKFSQGNPVTLHAGIIEAYAGPNRPGGDVGVL